MLTRARWRIAFALALAASCFGTPPANAQKTKAGLTVEINGNFPDNSANAITPATARATFTDMVNSWQQYAGVNPQAGTTYTVQLSDYGQLLNFSNAGAIAVSLPQAAGSFSAFNFTIQVASTAGNVTITPTGGSTIDGAASYVVSPNTSLWVVSDGTNWQVAKGSGSGIVNLGTANHLAFYAASSAAISSAPDATIVNGALTLGAANSVIGTISLTGSTSGTATITPQATAGAPTLTLPNASGTFAVSATAPLVIDAGTGNATITGLAGGVLAGAGPAFTRTPTLGASGTLGTLGFGNATSGTVTLQPVAGALGSSVLTMPAATDTIAVLAAAQALTGKTYNGLTVTTSTGTLTIPNGVTVTGPASNATLAGLGVTNAFSGANSFSGVTTWTGSLVVPMRTVTAAGAVTVSATTDYFVCINKTVGATTTVNLPGSPTTGFTVLIKDCKGDAAANNITLTPASGNIDGGATFVMNTNYQSAAVTYSGSAWSLN